MAGSGPLEKIGSECAAARAASRCGGGGEGENAPGEEHADHRHWKPARQPGGGGGGGGGRGAGAAAAGQRLWSGVDRQV